MRGGNHVFGMESLFILNSDHRVTGGSSSNIMHTTLKQILPWNLSPEESKLIGAKYATLSNECATLSKCQENLNIREDLHAVLWKQVAAELSSVDTEVSLCNLG